MKSINISLVYCWCFSHKEYKFERRSKTDESSPGFRISFSRRSCPASLSGTGSFFVGWAEASQGLWRWWWWCRRVLIESDIGDNWWLEAYWIKWQSPCLHAGLAVFTREMSVLPFNKDAHFQIDACTMKHINTVSNRLLIWKFKIKSTVMTRRSSTASSLSSD